MRAVTANRVPPVVLMLFALLAPQPVVAGPPRDDLLGLVPGEPAFCLAVQDLRGQSQRLLESPFGKRFVESPVFSSLRDAEPLRKLLEIDEQLKAHLQTSLAEIRDDVLGDAFVLAFWPTDGVSPEKALVLAQARNKELPVNVLRRLNDVQLQSGELTRVETVTRGQVSYVQTTEAGGKVNFQLVHDGLVALTSDEGMLHQVIDRISVPPARRDQTFLRAFADLGVDRDAAVFWINPRAFDRHMAEKLQQAAEPQASFLRAFRGYWQQTTGVAIAAHVGDAIEMRLSVRMPIDGASVTMQRFLKEAQRPSALWQRVPEDAILAAAARFDPAELLNLVGEFMPADQRAAKFAEANRTTLALLGMDLQDDLLARLGPDWCFYVSDPRSSQVIPDVVVAVAMRGDDQRGETEEAFTESLRTLGGLLALQRTNQGKPTVLRRGKQGTVKVTSLWSEHGFSGGLQPAGAVKEGCLVLASSPDAVGRFGVATGHAIPKTGPFPLLKFSFTRAAAYLNDAARRPALVAALAEMNQQSAAEVEQRLQNLTAFCALFDELTLAQEAAPGRVTFHLRVKTHEPLAADAK